MPAAEVSVDEALVSRLVADQYPALAGLPIRRIGDTGWDNTVFRLGRDFSVRLPRRAAAARLVGHEARWLAGLSRGLTMPVPVPIHHGAPSDSYPWQWSINRWVPGNPLGVGALQDPGAAAAALADFLAALHKPAPPNAPVNKFRGVPLPARRRAFVAACDVIARSGRDMRPALEAWHRLSSAPRYRGPRLWVHGDFHSANILTLDGWLSGVIDFGDLTSGDPAVDFAVAWMVFDAADRGPLQAAADRHGPGTWQRAQAWALALGAAALSRSADNPLLAQIGARAIEAASARTR